MIPRAGADNTVYMEGQRSTDPVEHYLTEVETVVRAISRTAVRAIVDRLYSTWQSGRTAFIVGNGGSASTASHMMNDLNKFTIVEGLRRFRAIALTDDIPLMTALANDREYADIFVEPLKNFMEPDDTLIAISGSGNSENVIRAAQYARSIGGTVIGLCGNPGSRLATLADIALTVSASIICMQEDAHLVVNHVVALALRERIAASVTTARAT
jgi:D-sedoheptulose 7-phosphate isomerase